MKRFDFSEATKKIIAERAGYQCSYPNCGLRTSGPGAETHSVTRAGVAAHIYSAALNGPRGRGGLTENELTQPANGIWLCAIHAKLIDDNQGVGHPPEVLLSYKGLHEGRVQKELLGICPLTGWIHEVEFLISPLFAPSAKARFGKLNLIYGQNAVGKTILWKTVMGIFKPSLRVPWQKPGRPELDVRLTYFQPQLTSVRLLVNGADKLLFEIDGLRVPWNPLPMNVVVLRDIRHTRQDEDDRLFFSRVLDMPDWQIDGLVDHVNAFPYSNVRNAHFVKDEDGVNLTLDMFGTHRGFDFRMLSSSEQQIVLIEFASAAARHSARYCPTVLVVDCACTLSDKWFSSLEHHLLDPANQFQTLMCVPMEEVDLQSIYWRGWEVIRLFRPSDSGSGRSGDSGTIIAQDPKL